MHDQPVRAVPLTGSDQTIRSGVCVYHGITLRETAGSAAATALVYDGTSAAGTLLDTVYLAANGITSLFYERGVLCEKGIFVDVGGTGVLQGSVRVTG